MTHSHFSISWKEYLKISTITQENLSGIPRLKIFHFGHYFSLQRARFVRKCFREQIPYLHTQPRFGVTSGFGALRESRGERYISISLFRWHPEAWGGFISRDIQTSILNLLIYLLVCSLLGAHDTLWKFGRIQYTRGIIYNRRSESLRWKLRKLSIFLICYALKIVNFIRCFCLICY